MQTIDILVWMIGIGFTFNFTLMLVMWTSLNSRMNQIEHKIEKLDEKVTDIDRRLCRLEGAFSSKEFCMLKDDKQLKRVE